MAGGSATVLPAPGEALVPGLAGHLPPLPRVGGRLAPVRTRRGLLSTGPGRTAAAALALAAAPALAACQLASPLTTDLDYEPADGVSVYVDDVVVRDLIVLGDAAGSEGTVTGLVANKGSEPVSVTLQLGEGPTDLAPTLEIGPGQAVRLDGQTTGEPGEPMTIPQVPGEPGSYTTLRVVVDGGSAESASVPILTPEGPYAQDGADQAESTSED